MSDLTASQPAPSEPILIIGAGLAGWTTVREFRKLDTTTPVVLVTADSGDFYAKPTLSNAYAQKRTPAQLVSTPAAKMVETLNVTLLAQHRVESLDTAARSVVLGHGGQTQTLHYSRLVLATGAQPIRIPVGGTGADQVKSINNLDDFGAFHQALGVDPSAAEPAAPKTVLIMGAGLIGCEFANDLVHTGATVHVVDPGPRPLSLLLPAEAGDQLRTALEALGVVWHFGTTVTAVDGTDSGLTVQLADGGVVSAHMVLSAIGLRADTALAAAAGLVCERGIVVDDMLQTSALGVYALGDCAQYASAGQRPLPYVMPIMNAAKALAATLAGTPTALVFPLMPVSIKTPALPIVVAAAHPALAGAWKAGDGEGIWQFTDGEGTQRGFVLTGKSTARRMEQSKATQP
ncbi:FAD-dependent oxidoreductase [Rhodoferax saidenbachensis]|uniref:Rubredoxin-NAD+ reductase n=1 Tax=Rhodoferax saidenbachensis TaxID=1484693 RepID=A0ABU1ZPC5_9BURK|nr:FAD-dependent oxidoreductase [Rhodoferax saidenbachensis]MDR7307343.1 rubredoxin-NAD+ reductase [Rhodoferax saidenbachensis]